MRSKERPIGVDLFAGAGGMTLGFEQAGFDVLAAVELDPIHCAIHEFNFPFWSILCQSVVDTTGEEIRKQSNIGDRDIDVVFGGPPCQGFSIMGKRALDDPRNSLVLHFLRLVVELKPKFFVMENVPGLTTSKYQNFLSEVIEEFNSRGYEVEGNYKVLNAAHYGVPQNRARVFLLGCRQGFSLPKYPPAITRVAYSGKKANCNEFSLLPVCPTVWDAIADLPEVNRFPELLNQDWVIAEYSEPSSYSRLLCAESYKEDDYSCDRSFFPKILTPSMQLGEVSLLRTLTSSLRTKHTLESIARFSDTLPGKKEPISRFYKLHPKGICNTLRAGTASNRGAFTSPRPIHPFTPRCITVREAARLHSYPDWFRFHVTKWHGNRQVGNSVPPMLAKAVAAEIIRALGVSPVKPVGSMPIGEEKLLQLNMFQASRRYRVDPRVIEPRKRGGTRG